MDEKNVNLKTALPGPVSKEMGELREKNVPKGLSSLTPVYAAEAEGALLKDVDGNVFLDFVGGIGVLNAGHCPPEVVKSVKEQLDKFLHTCFQVMPYEPYVKLAEQLNQLVPGNFPKKTMFVNSGAEAVENAVKIARRYTKKTGIISLDCSFHGRTYLGMSLTGKVKPYRYHYGPFVADTYKIPSPYCYRCLQYKEYPGCNIECLEFLERFFITSVEPDRIAAIIIEPVEGEGGFIVTPPEYFEKLRAICDKHNILMICDEIQTGFGRTGKFLAMEHSGVAPDITTTAKSLGAGLPISAVTGKAEIMDAVGPGEIGTTYGGNPLACIAALEVVKMMKEKDLPARSQEIGDKIFARLKDLQAKHSFIGDIRGQGAMVAIETVKPGTREPDPAKAGQIIGNCINSGLLVLKAGIYDNVVRMLVPLVITEEQLASGLDLLQAAIEK